MDGLYINLYVARIIQEYLRRQPFCRNPVVDNPDAWINPEQIHKHFEKPTARQNEGQGSESQRTPPLIEVKCVVANPCGPRFVGNWDLEVEVAITNDTQNTTDLEHESRVNDVLVLFFRDELIPELISVQPNFFTPRIIQGPISETTEGQSMTTTASFKFLACCARDCR